jgi:hypothetical protein
MKTKRSLLIALLAAFSLFAMVAPSARAGDVAATIRFIDRKWSPLLVTIPANRPTTIRVANDSKETIEFESFKLNREKTVSPGETIIVRLPALAPGEYDFYDDFHQDVPQGTIVAK